MMSVIVTGSCMTVGIGWAVFVGVKEEGFVGGGWRLAHDGTDDEFFECFTKEKLVA